MRTKGQHAPSNDRSYYSEDGKLLVEHYYDLVVFHGESKEVRAVNNHIENNMKDFYK